MKGCRTSFKKEEPGKEIEVCLGGVFSSTSGVGKKKKRGGRGSLDYWEERKSIVASCAEKGTGRCASIFFVTRRKGEKKKRGEGSYSSRDQRKKRI